MSLLFRLFLSKLLRGELAEWSNAAVLKTVVSKGTKGSNPLLSAINHSVPFGLAQGPSGSWLRLVI